jgi:hypothetical protein
VIPCFEGDLIENKVRIKISVPSRYDQNEVRVKIRKKTAECSMLCCFRRNLSCIVLIIHPRWQNQVILKEIFCGDLVGSVLLEVSVKQVGRV